MAEPRKQTRRSFGKVKKERSGRYQASYTGPDGARHLGPRMFALTLDADVWLSEEYKLISNGSWTAPGTRQQTKRNYTLQEYAPLWLGKKDIKPRTIAHYNKILESMILPWFGSTRLDHIQEDDIWDWWRPLHREKPTYARHAYVLFRSIMESGVKDRRVNLDHNPCQIEGATKVTRKIDPKPATFDELETILETLPAKYGAMVVLATWCGLRFGELIGLRRDDIDLRNGEVHVRRAIARANGEIIEGSTKSEAGLRSVAIPPHVIPMIRSHLGVFVGSQRDALVFPAANGEGYLATSTFHKQFYKARKAAGRPDLRFHDLRHTGATLAALSGATLAELMHRMGHSTQKAAMRYQHVAQGRDKQIADNLSAYFEGNNSNQ